MCNECGGDSLTIGFWVITKPCLYGGRWAQQPFSETFDCELVSGYDDTSVTEDADIRETFGKRLHSFIRRAEHLCDGIDSG